MDREEESSLAALLAEVPAPRRARGKRHAWPRIRILIGAALAGGARGMAAVLRWVAARQEALVGHLRPPRGALPSGSTLRRAVRALDCAALAARVAACVAGLPAPAGPAPARWQGVAVAGKARRGAHRRGAACHLVRPVRHADGYPRRQAAVGAKTNERTAVPGLLAGHDRRGCVGTLDALLAPRALAAPLVAPGGHSLVVGKGNQPTRHEARAAAFAGGDPGWPGGHHARHRTGGQGHGRLATRTLVRTAALNDLRPWPQVGPVLPRTDHAIARKRGRVRHAVTSGLTRLPAAATTPAAVARRWRGHGTSAHRVHAIRDVACGEDAHQARVGSTPQALAALRTALMSLLRCLGWRSSTTALAHYGAYVPRALHLLQHPPTRL